MHGPVLRDDRRAAVHLATCLPLSVPVVPFRIHPFHHSLLIAHWLALCPYPRPRSLTPLFMPPFLITSIKRGLQRQPRHCAHSATNTKVYFASSQIQLLTPSIAKPQHTRRSISALRRVSVPYWWCGTLCCLLQALLRAAQVLWPIEMCVLTGAS